MKITDIETTYLSKPFPSVVASSLRQVGARDILLVRVRTDEGIDGLSFLTGVHYPHGSEMPILETIIQRALKPTVVGSDPRRAEMIWQQMYRSTLRFGQKGAVIRAISGVDCAIWDAACKYWGASAFDIAGGFRTEVPAYASGGYFSDGGTDALVAEMEDYVRQGFSAVKIKVGRRTLEEDTERVAAVRAAIGGNVKLMIDVNEAYDLNTAIRAARLWAKYDPFWIEEPLLAHDIENYGKLAAKTDIPIAAGESEYTRWGFRELALRGGVRVLQPDVTRVGGMTEWLKVVHFASSLGLPVAGHYVQELHLPLMGAADNGLYVEWFNSSHPVQDFVAEVFTEPKEAATPKAGILTVPTAPGFALQVNQEAVSKYRQDSCLVAG